MADNYTKLKNSVSSFEEMMDAFGVVTVMNARIYEIDNFSFEDNTAQDILDHYLRSGKLLATIDTLKMANITIDGPTKTITGGQYSNPLIKFGKSARLEMQDALGRANAIEAFGGSVNEYGESTFQTVKAVHITEDFAPTRLVIGDSFFISRKTGQQVKVNIIFYQVLPDSIFNLNQDSEGDATVFDMNADLLTTNIKLPTETSGKTTTHGVFYSILPYEAAPKYTVSVDAQGKVTVTRTPADARCTYQYSEDGGLNWKAFGETNLDGKTIDIAEVKDGDYVVIFNNYKVVKAAA